MKNIRYALICLLTFMAFGKAGFATHISGGEIYFEHLTGNSYTVNVDLYQDCSGNQLLGATTTITISSDCGANFNVTGNLVNTPDGTEISQLCTAFLPNSACNGGTLPGMKRYSYTAIVTLSPTCNAWTASWQQCCRNTAANLIGQQGTFLFGSLNTVNDDTNSSPQFTAEPIPFVCINQQVNYNYGAVDAENDSLVYSFVPALINSTTNSVTYNTAGGFSATNPINGIVLNSATGQLTFTPTATGNFVIVVEVQEYDRTTGLLLGVIRRDIQFVVENCSNNIPQVPTAITGFTGTAQATGNLQVTADVGENFCFNVIITDPNISDTLTVTSNVTTVLPGATFVVNGTNPAIATICWTATSGMPVNNNFSIFVDDGACPVPASNSLSLEVIVPVPPPLGVTLSKTDVTCNGVCDGTVTATVVGGVGPFSYSWITNPPNPTGQGTASITGLCPGTPTLILTDLSDNSQVVSSISVLEPAAMVISTSSTTHETCNNDCSGTISVLANGGTGTLTYTWDDPSNTVNSTVSNLCRGVYNVTVSDDNGCTLTEEFFLTGPPEVVAVIDSTNDVSCNGGNDGQAFASGFGGSSASTSTNNYRVYQDGTFNPYNLTNGDAFVFSNPGGLDDNVSDAVTIGFNFEFFGVSYNQLRVSTNGFITFDNTLNDGCCLGQTVPNALAPQNFIAFAWNDLNPGVGGTMSYKQAGTAPNRILIINFDAVPHFSGTPNITSQIILYETSNIIEIHSTDISSNGTNHTMGIENATGTAGFSVPGRNSADWGTITNDYVAFIPDQTLSFTWPSGGTNANETGLSAGTYCVTVTDGAGCTDTACAIVNEPPALAPTITVDSPISCPGVCDGELTASSTGGTAPFTFAWSTGASTASVTGLCAGTYTVTVTDANGCTDTEQTTLTDPPGITVSITPTDASCNGICDGQAVASTTNGTAPFTFAWSSGGSAATETGLCAGTYTVTVTDANGCTGTGTTTISEPALLTLSASANDASCNGVCDGDATATAGGGTAPYTFAWSSGGSAATETGLCAGTYTATVTDANGCTATATATVSEPAALVIAVTGTDASCNGVCDGTATASVTSGGTAPFTFNWSNGSSGANLTGLCAGTYTVTVNDANGCTQTSNVVISAPPAITLLINITSQISCAGTCDGVVSAFASGGTLPYVSFNWSNGGSGSTLTGLCAGTYTLTVTDNIGCTATETVTLVDPPAISLTMSSTDASCNGVCDGTATATVASGGTAPFTFAWSNAGTSGTETGLCAGTYTVTVTDANGCTATGSTTVNEPAALSVAIATTDASCFGVCDGTASATVLGGTSPFTITWPGGGTGTNLCAGTFTLTVTDANGCTATAPYTITEPAAIVSNVAVTDASCNGVCDGTATASVTSGGTAPFTFAWSTGATSAGLTGLCAGTYTVTITDANGCTDQNTAVIAEPPAIVLTTSVLSPITCNGVCDGVVTVAASGGTLPFVGFAWSSGGTSSTESGLCAGTYTVTVTDNIGCTQTAQVILTEPDAIVLSTSATDVVCNGDCNGTTTVSITSGGTAPFTFAWSSGGASATDTALCAGTYTVTVSDANGCTATATATVTEPNPLTVAIATVDASCGGVCDGSASATVLGGTAPYTLTWPGGGTGTNLCAGTYTMTVTDGNGCTATQGYTITEPAPMVTSVSGIVNATCNGECDGTATISVTSGGTAPYTFSWTNGSTLATPIDLCAGTNFVTVTDANGCTVVDSAVITEPLPLAATITTIPATCPGVCDGQAIPGVSGGTGPYVFFWSSGNNVNICAGSYDVTITDANGCTLVEPFTITAPAPIQLAFTGVTDATCNGTCDGSATVGVTSGGTAPFTFVWSTGTTGTIDTTLCAGTHTVTVTDANGCTGIDSVIINEPTAIAPTVAVNSNVTCNGGADGSLTVTPNGGTSPYTFLWSNGAGTATITGLTAGTYTVTVTDGNGCTETASGTITEPVAIVTAVTLINNAGCNGACDGAALAAVTSGGTAPFTFQWSNGGNAALDTNLCAGMNYVTVTDASGCTAEDSILITQPGAVTLSVATTDASCNGVCDGTATGSASGGTAPYTFAFSTGTVGQTETGLCAGTYTIAVVDANGCGDTVSFTITEPAAIVTAFTGVVDADCNGNCNGEATIGVTSGGTAPFTFNWSNGGSGTNQTGLCAGTYTVTVTDGNGCTAIDSVTINQPGNLTAILVSSTDATCNGVCDGSATVGASGGTAPYTLAWPSGNSGTTETGLCAGTVTVTVTDANGCSTTLPIVITEPGAIVAAITNVNNASCGGVCDGTATASVTSGGTAPFTFQWSNGVIGPDDTTLCAGTNTVTITDANGCTQVENVIITEPTPITATLTGGDASCNGVCDGTVTTAVSGGTAPYTFLWSNGSNSQNLTGLCAATYTVTITDANGCTTTSNVVINEPAPIVLAFTNVVDADCGGTCNGSANVGVTSGGTGPFTFAWSNGGSGTSQSLLCAGTYTVTVTDASGCTGIDSVTIAQPGTLTALTLAQFDASCFGVCDGGAAITVVGGTFPYTYAWPSGSTLPVDTGLCAGTYDVTVTDNNGCFIIETVVINEPAEIVLDFIGVTNAGCAGVCDGSATVNILSGGIAPFTYSWSTGTTIATDTALCVGTHFVTVTDADGCSSVDSVVITGPNAMSVTINSLDASCNGVCDGLASAIVTGGIAPYTYAWSTGGSNAVENNLCAGTYTVTVTDANGCSITQTTVINEPPPIVTAFSNIINVGCNGTCDGQAVIGVTSGGVAPFTYQWSTGTTGTIDTTLCAGTHTVTVTDATGCTSVNSVVITQPGGLTMTVVGNDISCNGVCDGLAVAQVSGGSTPYTYAWSNGGTTDSISGLCAGTYTVTLTDGAGCSVVDSVTITEPAAIVTAISNIGSAGCGGACDGTATVTVTSGGTGPFTYLWTSGGTAATDTTLCAGMNYVTVTDANGCTAIDSALITAPNALAVTVNPTDVSCTGVCDGTATAVVTGGVTPYTYAWPSGGSLPTENGLCAGNYTFTLTDATGCTVTVPFTIGDPGPIVLGFSNVNDPTCAGNCDGTATVNITSGGTAPFTYLWTTGAITDTITGLCAGTYTVTVTDANGCTGVDSVNLADPPVLTATLTGVDASCNGTCDGEAQVAVSGGVGPYSYSWSSGGSTPNVNGLCAGTHTVTVTDASGCTLVDSTVIGEPAPIVVIFSNIGGVICFGDANGTATASVASGGTAPFTFSWPSGESGPTAVQLSGGSNIVTVTDNNGCTATSPVLIAEPTQLLANVSGISLSCGGTCDGIAFAAPTGGNAGGYTFQWSNGATTDTISGLCAGTYSVTVTDPLGCTDSGSYVVTSPTPILVTDTTQDATCGVCDGAALLFVSGGTGPYTYNWPSGSVAPGDTALCAGLYNVTVTDQTGCTVVHTVAISNFTPNITTSDSTNNVSCNGAADGNSTVFLNNSAGPPPVVATYLWTPSGQNTQTATGLAAGTYNVEITDVSGCVYIHTVTITEPDPIVVTAVGTDATCNGTCDGQADVPTVTGGTGAYTYNWSNGGTGSSLTGLCAGTYTVTVNDANGCTGTATVIINEPTAITLFTTVSVPISCNGVCDGEVTTAGTGGVLPYQGFAWSNGQTGTTATGLCAGTYTVTVTDANGCTGVDSITITEPTAVDPGLATTNPISCNGTCDGEITSTPSGGTGPYVAFAWSDGQTSATATGLCAGTYTVTVTDANGCTGVDSMTIAEPTPITLDSVGVTDATCGVCDGQIATVVSGGTGTLTFDWGNGQTTATATALCAGIYNLTVTDANGCTAVFPIPLSNIGGPTIATTSSDVSCNGACDGTASVAVTAGTGPFTYLWSPGGQTTDSISGLCAGVYGVEVTDSNGCVTADTTLINEPPPFTITFNTTPISCGGVCDASVTAVAAGGTAPLTYSWSNGDTTSTLNNLCAGTYTVTITGATGCTSVDSVTIVQPAPFVPTIAGTDVTCFGACDGTATVTPTGGTAPYTFTWSNGDTTAALTGLCAGTYSVIVSDAGGCSDTLSVVITEPSQLVATFATIDPNCGASDGTATINVTGGTPFTSGAPYTYLWTPTGQTGQTAAGLAAGAYTVLVTDSIGCTEVFTLLLGNQGGPAITLNAQNNMSCNGICDGSIDIDVAGGPFTYSWTGPGGFTDTTQDINNLCAGTYIVEVTDATGCISLASFDILEPDTLEITSIATDFVGCGGSCNGTATVNVQGGTAPYSVNWSSGSTDTTATGLCAGMVFVTVTDAGGCSVVDSALIVEPAPLVITLDSLTNTTCSNSNDGAIAVSVTGGTGAYTYNWTASDSSNFNVEDLTNISAGTYTLVVTDSVGCTDTLSVTINSTVTVVANAIGDTVLCTGTGSSATLTAVGASGLTVQWLDSAGAVLGTDTTLVVSPNSGITEYYLLVSSGICTDLDTVRVEVSGSPAADAGNSVTIFQGGQVTLGGAPTGPAGASFLWSPSSSLVSNPSVENPLAEPDSTTTYTVTVTSPEGCIGVDTVTINVVLPVNVVDGFTPNDDGVNDVWEIEIVEFYPDADVFIFNRWGQLLFSSPGYVEKWDGTYNGERLPVGTYYYVIDLKDPNIEPLTGPVSIIR